MWEYGFVFTDTAFASGRLTEMQLETLTFDLV